MSAQLTAGLRNTVEQFTQYRAREVWGLRVSPWKLHALKNSHVFRRWDDPVNFPEGSEMPSLHTIEKRLGINYLFPDETDRPSWDTLPVRNVTNLAKEYMVKIRGSQAQLTAGMTEIEVCGYAGSAKILIIYLVCRIVRAVFFKLRFVFPPHSIKTFDHPA